MPDPNLPMHCSTCNICLHFCNSSSHKNKLEIQNCQALVSNPQSTNPQIQWTWATCQDVPLDVMCHFVCS